MIDGPRFPGCEPCREPRPVALAEDSAVAALRRVTALFQARQIAMILGAPMPDPEAFRADSTPRNGRATAAE